MNPVAAGDNPAGGSYNGKITPLAGSFPWRFQIKKSMIEINSNVITPIRNGKLSHQNFMAEDIAEGCEKTPFAQCTPMVNPS
ncbi:MAG: hypothetical protein BWY67_01909 [Bacteroidetes bacterium ADurb.Bin397]|nr:MAG: hypothetical protein BWY67_01909 [Bacteroidetes bacterium ADurb.Bin397]